jgi:hypothetical protein
MRSVRSFAVLLVLVAAVVGGCAHDSPPSPSGTATGRPTLTSSAEPTPAAARPALTDLELTTEGIEYVVLGQPVPVVDPVSAIIQYDPDGCGAGVGTWLTTYDDPTQDVLIVLTENSEESTPVRWILIETTEIGTDRGIHAGDSREAVLSAYPEAQPYPLSRSDMEMFIVRGTAGMLLFEFSVDNAEYPVGELLYLRALAIDVEADGIFSIANTGAGGACSS